MSYKLAQANLLQTICFSVDDKIHDPSCLVKGGGEYYHQITALSAKKPHDFILFQKIVKKFVYRNRKLLSGTRIIDRWKDPRSGKFYVLVGLDNDFLKKYQRLATSQSTRSTIPNEQAVSLNTVGSQTSDSSHSPERMSKIESLLANQQQILAKLQAEIATGKAPKKSLASPTFHTSVDRPDYRSPRHPNAFALVIGVETYPGGIPKAEFADRDAQAMVAHLRALGVPLRHIKRLTDDTATRSRIKGALHWLKRNVRSGSTVYVYFSGHGAPSQGGTAYLVPFDGDLGDLSDTGVSTSTFYRSLEHLPARHIIVALDACFTGEGKRSVLGKGIRPLVTKIREGAVPSSGKLVVFTAARSDQESGILDFKGHGLFTYYLLKGLNGGAERGGHVTVASLYRYLKPKVQSDANLDNRSQTPELEPRNLASGGSVRLR